MDPASNPSAIDPSPRRGLLRRAGRWAAAVAGTLLALVACLYGYVRYQYPYGGSHCCDLGLYSGLQEYAFKHDGKFPSGEATPEASLSLLCENDPANWADLLRGKTVPVSRVREILERGERLGPDSCGWHYVEGLTLDCDPRLALFWDKVGLEHYGERSSDGSRIVMFADGNRRHIPAAGWTDFLRRQEQLLAERSRGEEIRADAFMDDHGDQVQVQLRAVDGKLIGRAWRKPAEGGGWMVYHGGSLARVGLPPHEEEEHEEADVERLPVVSAEDVRQAKSAVDEENGWIRFSVGDREVLFQGRDFRVE